MKNLIKLSEKYKRDCERVMKRIEYKVKVKNQVNNIKYLDEMNFLIDEEFGDIKFLEGVEIYLISGILYIKHEDRLILPILLPEVNGKILSDYKLNEFTEEELCITLNWIKLTRGVIFALIGDYERVETEIQIEVFRELYNLYYNGILNM